MTVRVSASFPPQIARCDGAVHARAQGQEHLNRRSNAIRQPQRQPSSRPLRPLLLSKCFVDKTFRTQPQPELLDGGRVRERRFDATSRVSYSRGFGRFVVLSSYPLSCRKEVAT